MSGPRSSKPSRRCHTAGTGEKLEQSSAEPCPCSTSIPCWGQHLPRLATNPLIRPLLRQGLCWLLTREAFTEFARKRHPLPARPRLLSSRRSRRPDFDYWVSEATREHSRQRPGHPGREPPYRDPLDGLALLCLLGRIRPERQDSGQPDIGPAHAPAAPLLLPVDSLGARRTGAPSWPWGAPGRRGPHHLPRRRVSRLGPKGVKGRPLAERLPLLARRTARPLVPVHLDGRNSLSFYLAAWLNNDSRDCCWSPAVSPGGRPPHPSPWGAHPAPEPRGSRPKTAPPWCAATSTESPREGGRGLQTEAPSPCRRGSPSAETGRRRGASRSARPRMGSASCSIAATSRATR